MTTQPVRSSAIVYRYSADRFLASANGLLLGTVEDRATAEVLIERATEWQIVACQHCHNGAIVALGFCPDCPHCGRLIARESYAVYFVGPDQTLMLPPYVNMLDRALADEEMWEGIDRICEHYPAADGWEWHCIDEDHATMTSTENGAIVNIMIEVTSFDTTAPQMLSVGWCQPA